MPMEDTMTAIFKRLFETYVSAAAKLPPAYFFGF